MPRQRAGSDGKNDTDIDHVSLSVCCMQYVQVAIDNCSTLPRLNEAVTSAYIETTNADHGVQTSDTDGALVNQDSIVVHDDG